MTSARECPADSIPTSASGLMEELHRVRDSVEELYLLLDHIWRNREELYDILVELTEEERDGREDEDTDVGHHGRASASHRFLAPTTRRSDEISETIACAYCDVDSPESLAAALQEGWTDLCRDDGTGWNYLGVCPDCQA